MFEVSMYRADRTRIQLADLLAQIPDNDWTWQVIEFDGVGQMPNNESLLEFQQRVRGQPLGLVISWSELTRFAQGIEYTIDCLIVAVSRGKQLNLDKVMADEFDGCEVAVRAIDSAEWIIFSSNNEIFRKLESAT